MKKALKVIRWILGLLVVLIIGAMVAIQSSVVQTAVGQYVVSRLEEQMDADIVFEKVSVTPFNAIIVKNLVVRDKEPRIEGMDTLLSVNSLTAKFSLTGLLRGDMAKVSRLRLSGGSFHLVMEPAGADGEPDVNITRIFGIKEDDTKERKAPEWGNILSAKHIEIENILFRMDNLPAQARMAERGKLPDEGAIDWNHFCAELVSAEIDNLKVADSKIQGQNIKVHILEKVTGWEIREASVQTMTIGNGVANLEEVKLNDGFTSLNLEYFRMEGTLDDYSDFENKVVFDSRIREGSVLDMKGTLGHIASDLQDRGMRMKLRGRVRGATNAIGSDNLYVEDLDSGVKLHVGGRFVNATDLESTSMSFQVKELVFGMKNLEEFLEEWSPESKLNLGHMARGEEFSFAGTVEGLLQDFGVKGGISSGIGEILADVSIKDVVSTDKPITIGGNLGTRELDLGKMLGNASLGPANLNAALGLSIGKKSLDFYLDTLNVSSLHALGYNYSGIGASGSMVGKALKASITSADPNLALSFTGDMDLDQERPGADGHFSLELPYADLHALNLDPRRTSRISLSAGGEIVRQDIENASGTVFVKDIVLESESGRNNVGTLTASTQHAGNRYTIDVRSPFADASFEGNRPAIDFASELTGIIFGEKESDFGTYGLTFQIKEAQNILAFVKRGMYTESGTGGSIGISEDGTLDVDITSGRLAIYDKYIKDLKLKAKGREGSIGVNLNGSAIDLGGTLLKDNNLGLTAKLSRSRAGVDIEGSIRPSETHIGDAQWNISSGAIRLGSGDISIDSFMVESNGQSLDVSGGYSKEKTDTLRIRMNKFDLATVNTFIGETPKLSGNATGRAMLLSPSGDMPGLLAAIICDSVEVSGHPMGRVVVRSNWDEENKCFATSLRNTLDGQTNMDVRAKYFPSGKDIMADAKFNSLELGFAAPLLASLFSTFEGKLDGEVGVSGTIGKPSIQSRDLRLSDGTIAMGITGVPYKVDGGLLLDDGGLHFQSVSMQDGEGGTGSIEGVIDFRNLDDIAMNLRIPFRGMHVLDVEMQEGATFYGSVYGTGRVNVSGNLSHLLVDVSATSRDGDLHIPLGSFGDGGTTNLLTFVNSNADEDIDPYEKFIGARKEKIQNQTDLELKLRVNARPGTNIHLDVDEETSLHCTGNGSIDIFSRAKQSIFTLGGDYTISSGNFHFSAMSIVSRNFTILDGSSIRFNGDLWNTDLNVNGRYTTKASLAPITSQDASSTRRTVYCGLNISGKLSNPELDFSVEVPDLNPTIQAELDAALSTEDRIQKQFIYLLVAGSFLPSEESGISTGSSDVLLSNVSSIMTGQLNNIFQKLDIPLDLGLGFKSTQAGNNLFDVAVSTQLFNNRVVVNGTVGNKEQLGGASASEVAGDIDIEIKLNRSGSFRLNLFSHSADQLSSYLDNSQRHGGGFAYQREFNTFTQLWREIFGGRKAPEEAARRTQNYVTYQVDSTGNITRDDKR